MEVISAKDGTFRFLDLPLELQRHVISLLYSLSPVTMSMNPQTKKYRLDKLPPISPLLVNHYFYEHFKSVIRVSFPRRVVFDQGSSNLDHGIELMNIVSFHQQTRKFLHVYANRVERIDGAPWVWNFQRWMQRFPALRVIRFADFEFTKRSGWFGGEVKLFKQSLADMLGGKEDMGYSEDVIRRFRNHFLMSVSKAYCNEELVAIQAWYKRVVKDVTITFAHILELSGRGSPWSEEYKRYNMPGDLLLFHFKISHDGERAILTRKEFRKSKDFVPNLLKPRLLQARFPRYGTDADGRAVKDDFARFRDINFVTSKTAFNMPNTFTWKEQQAAASWTPESFQLKLTI